MQTMVFSSLFNSNYHAGLKLLIYGPSLSFHPASSAQFLICAQSTRNFYDLLLPPEPFEIFILTCMTPQEPSSHSQFFK